MLQLFLQTATITANDWDKVYPQIVRLAEAFPLRLIRIEAYNGFERDKQDKDFFDLVVNRGQENDYLCFYGDWMSWTAGTNVYFYKNWEQHCELALQKTKSDPARPVTWFPPTPFKDDGSWQMANGESTTHGYIDPRGALYRYAVIAIGIFLENRLPGRAFLTAEDEKIGDIEQITAWLEGHLGEKFELPVYFDRKRLLNSFAAYYDNPRHCVERLEHLYRKQFKRNMAFALEHIGYEPTFAFYTEVLSNCWFGTFGFSDVLDPWIAVTQDLESALHLVTESKRLRLERGDTQQANKYNLNRILEEWLQAFILWSPSQREELEQLYTNQHALETGKEDLPGSIFRMTGHRTNICPIVVSSDELFEAFMYQDPKNGYIFRKTIDDWIEKNSDVFDRLLEKLSNKNQSSTNSADDDESDNAQPFDPEVILLGYPAHERFFIQKVIAVNPAYFRLDEALDDLCRSLRETTEEGPHLAYVAQIREESNADKKTLILRQLKDKRHEITAGSHFEQWLDDEKTPMYYSFYDY